MNRCDPLNLELLRKANEQTWNYHEGLDQYFHATKLGFYPKNVEEVSKG